MRPYHVGILGATGLVGQRLVQRLRAHPWFRLSVVAASERSAGRTYGEATRWRIDASPPAEVAAMEVRSCDPGEFDDCDLVLSALDTGPARQIEPSLARAGLAVISNSSAFRQAEGVPLMIPEVNADHLAMLDGRDRDAGFIVTNPNCSTTGLVLGLAPLHERFGVRRTVVTTLQAISGAGIDGPRGFDLLDNVLPHIPGEEEKLESEVGKLFGSVDASGRLTRAEVAVSAHCHRVNTLDGHLAAVSVELGRTPDPAEAAACLAGWRGHPDARSLPSSPEAPIVVREEVDRPQPRLDRDTGGGMAVVVGRVRSCPVLGLKLELLSHNTVRGAAGGTLLNAELLAARDRLPRRSSR